MIEVHSIDLLSIAFYVTIGLGAAVLLSRRTAYLRSRYKAGAVSLFIIAMFLTLTGICGMMATAVAYRIMDIVGIHAGMWYNIQRFLWTTASIVTAVGMWLIVVIDNENLYDVFLKIRRSKGDEVIEQPESSDGQVGIESERIE